MSFFGLRLLSVNENWWKWRDDAVITLSHARNALEEGSIGVSPGGDRNEGYSSPLQFALAFIFFALVRSDYRLYLDLYVTTSIFLIGALFTLLLTQQTRVHVRGNQKALALALLGSGAVALIVMSSWAATGWLISGMENPLVVIAGLILLNLIAKTHRSALHYALLGFGVFLFGISRVELAAFTGPLLFGLLLVLWTEANTGRQRLIAWGLSIALPIGLWGVVHLSRLIYFGQLLPNTAFVQEKVPGSTQATFLIGFTLVAGIAILILYLSIPPRLKTVLFLGAGSFSVGLFFWSRFEDLDGLAGRGVNIPLIAGSLAVVAALLAVNEWLPSSRRSIDVIFLSLTFAPIAQYLVAGPARLDQYRVAGIALVFAAMWLVSLAATTVLGVSSRPKPEVSQLVAVGLWAVPLSLLGGIAMLESSSGNQPRGLCCMITPSEERILDVAAGMSSEFPEGALPIVSNPDLGKISFAKEAIMVDLGWLGDPLLARVYAERNDAVSDYMLHVARPDVVEAHQSWSCRYTAWLTNEGFSSAYEVREHDAESPAYGNDCVLEGKYTIWVRAEADFEHSLTREIVQSGRPLEVISTAVEACAADYGDVFRCQSVRRSVTRATPFLTDQGLLGLAAEKFETSPSAALDREIIARDAGWADRAYEAFLELLEIR